MNIKRQKKDGLITIEQYASTLIGWRGKPVSSQYVYKLIKENREKGKAIPFDWVEEGKKLWIKQ